MKQFLNAIVVASALLLATFIVGKVMLMSFDRDAVVQCHKLEQQAGEFKGFFLSKYEKALCDDHGILIDAPVQ